MVEEPPDASDVIDELRALEPLFHHPELGTRRADFAGMIADDFWEVGSRRPPARPGR